MGVSCQLQAPTALPPKESPRPHYIGGWMGLRTGLEVLEKRKAFHPNVRGISFITYHTNIRTRTA